MFGRHLSPRLNAALDRTPVVGLIGPRQVGKTTLAQTRSSPPVFIDLERPADRARLSDPEAALRGLQGRLVVPDEIQRPPDLFPVLRVLVASPQICRPKMPKMARRWPREDAVSPKMPQSRSVANGFMPGVCFAQARATRALVWRALQ
jgi:hypothetical protein